MVLEEKVLLRVASVVFRMGGAEETVTLVFALPSVSVTLKVAVCTDSSWKTGTVCWPNPGALTVS